MAEAIDIQPGELIVLSDLDASRLPIVPDAGCWVWHGERNRNGYGRICTRRGRGGRDLAHRFTYRLLVGPIPEGLYLDHLCRNRACVRPDHLEPVTNAENQRRGAGARLDWDKVRYIREVYLPRHPEFGARALGRRFGVTHEVIRKIINHQSWVAETPAS